MTWQNERAPEHVHGAITARMTDPDRTRPLKRTPARLVAAPAPTVRKVRKTIPWVDIRDVVVGGVLCGLAAYGGYVVVARLLAAQGG